MLLLLWMWEESGLLRWDVGAARFSVIVRSSKDWCLLFDSFNIQCVCLCACVCVLWSCKHMCKFFVTNVF